MSRETGVAIYFWLTIAGSISSIYHGDYISASIFAAAAGIIGTINLIARDL